MPPVIYKGKGYDDVHAKRFERSLQQIKEHLKPGARILELGGGGHFTEQLRAEGYDVTISQGDLRYASLPVGFDAALCMEVLEHIHDQESVIPTEWRGTGATHMLRQAHISLKPGGLLFITTPNADSINVINKVVHRQGPMVYRPHVREYSVKELMKVVFDAGFALKSYETWDPWHNSIDPAWEHAITKLLTDGLGASGAVDRGEDIFLWAHK